MPLDYWYKRLIAWFKEKAPDALKALQVERQTLIDSQEKTRVYAQGLFRHLEAAQTTSVYNQLVITQDSLGWQMRVRIAKPGENTSIQEFHDILDSKASTWKKMAKSGHYRRIGWKKTLCSQPRCRKVDGTIKSIFPEAEPIYNARQSNIKSAQRGHYGFGTRPAPAYQRTISTMPFLQQQFL